MYYAQPYDISATGFYFETMKEYDEKAKNNFNDFGGIVEEYEIQFIDGDSLDCKLFNDLQISQCNIHLYIDKIDEWDDQQKIQIIIASECGYDINLKTTDPDEFDIDLYEFDRVEELAEHFIEEGLFGDIPENITIYLDYEKIARDLSADYTETRIDNTNYIYRCS